jgi:hypothetical protein
VTWRSFSSSPYSGAPRDACEGHLDAAEATCAEEPVEGSGGGGAPGLEGASGTGAGAAQRRECYTPAAAGFRALLGSSQQQQQQQKPASSPEMAA